MGQSAALYARASTADQSCQRQIADLTAFANRCGYEIAGTFAETVSGAASRRPERDRIMRLARQDGSMPSLSPRSRAGAGRPRIFSLRFINWPAGTSLPLRGMAWPWNSTRPTDA